MDIEILIPFLLKESFNFHNNTPVPLNKLNVRIFSIFRNGGLGSFPQSDLHLQALLHNSLL